MRRHNLDTRLQRVIRESDQPHIARLAEVLRAFLASHALSLAPASTGFWKRWSRRLRAYEGRWVSPRRLKGAVVGGLGISSMWALGSLVVLIGMVTAPPDNVEVYWVVSGPGAGTHSVPLESVDFGTLLAVSTGLALRGLVGLLLAVAAMLLITGRERRGVVLGYIGLLLSLTTVTLLDFYFSQFGAIVGAVVQLALLMGVILYRRRYLTLEPGSGLRVSVRTSSEASSEARR